MTKTHTYTATTTWTGAGDQGTQTYKSYSRDYVMSVDGKADLPGTADPAFRGDPTRHNPEDMLVMSTSACHMLWYLHLCAVNGIRVLAYEDKAEGLMSQDSDGGGRFERIILRPTVTLSEDSDEAKAASLHDAANEKCFIANSLACAVDHEASFKRA